jgi:hypothetical protein
MELVTLNSKTLKDITHKNRTAEVTMTALALRERIRTFSDIPRTRAKLIKEGEKIVEADYIQLWKDLQAAGVGVIVNGQRNRPGRFEWHFSLKDVAAIALEDKTAKAAATQPKAERPKLKEAAPVAKAERLVYVSLRPGFDLAIKLPGDVTAKEIQTITNALSKVSA